MTDDERVEADAAPRPVRTAARALSAMLPPQYRRRSRTSAPRSLTADDLTATDAASRLDRLTTLLDAGMITDQEHAVQKAALVDQER